MSNTQDDAPVLSEHLDTVKVLTLNRPASLNAMNEALLLALENALHEANADPAVNIIVLRGAGRAFCTGKDLKEHEDLGVDIAAAEKAITLLHACSREILFGDKLVLAGVKGWAVGGGFELMLACDLVILNQDARLFFPEMPLGLFVTGGVTRILPKLVGYQRAKAMMLTGEELDAETALALGLAWKVVPDEEFENALMAAAQELSGMPQQSQRDLKRIMISDLREELEQAFELEAAAAVRGAGDLESMQRISKNRRK